MTTFVGGISSGPSTTPISAPLVAPGPISSRLTPQQIAAALGKTVGRPKTAPKIKVPKGQTKVTNVYGQAQPQQTMTPQTTQGPAPATQSAATSAATSAPLPQYDATAITDMAKNTFDVGNQAIALGDQTAASHVALQKALADIAYQQPRQQLALMEAANQRGGLGGTVYAGQAGDLAHQFATQQTDATDADTATQTANDKAILALNAGIPIFNWQQQAATAQRAIDAAQKDPATGQDLSVPVTTTPAPVATMPPKPANPSSGGHYVQHNGKWTLIHYAGAGRWLPGPPTKKGK